MVAKLNKPTIKEKKFTKTKIQLRKSWRRTIIELTHQIIIRGQKGKKGQAKKASKTPFQIRKS